MKINTMEGGIKCIYILEQNDCVFENNVIVRLKRKYGKYKRKIIKIEDDKVIKCKPLMKKHI